MEDIEDLLAGGGGGVPPGFRLPVTAAVGVKPRSKSRSTVFQDSLKSPTSAKIPGTQVETSDICVYLNAPRFFLVNFIFCLL